MQETLLFAKGRNRRLALATTIFAILVVFLAMLNRVQYGIEFSDESWYIAEPYAVAELGAVPFVNNVTQAAGFTIPLALAFKIYIWLNGSPAGIVFFSRVLYLCVQFTASFLFVWIVNRFTIYKIPLLAIAALLAINHCHSLYDITYNTIGMMYFPLIMALVFAEQKGNSRRSFVWGTFAGILAVRVVMGTPQTLVGLLIILFYLCAKKKWLRVAGIFTGLGLTCVAIFGSIIMGWGIESVHTWFLMLSKLGYFSIEIKKNWVRVLDLLLLFFRPAFMMVVILVILQIMLKKHQKIFALLWRLVIAMSLVVGVILSVHGNDYRGYSLLCYTWALPYFYRYYIERKDLRLDGIIIIFLAYLAIFFFASFTDAYGFSSSRAYWNYVPSVLIACLFCNEADDGGFRETRIRKLCSALFLACIMSLTFFGLWANYSYVYRDGSISVLSTKVEDGIWKGLYTTEVRAKNVVTLEQYIQSVTNADERIMCLDWVSFGYLMINGKICSPSTLDIAPYSYNVNSPLPYYLYFQVEQTVPDKIVYIDYGRDKQLSIDNSSWKFNELVWRYYHFANAYRNEIFYVRVYVLDNREGAMQLVEETLE